LRKIKAIDMLLLFSGLAAGGGTAAAPVDFARPIPANFRICPLPGRPAFVFTMCGAPGELESLRPFA